MLAKDRKLNLALASVRQRLKDFSRIHSDFLLVRYKNGNGLGMVVVGKNISRKATLRNKIKRHLYLVIESFFVQHTNVDIVVIVKKNQEINTLKQLLEKLLQETTSR